MTQVPDLENGQRTLGGAKISDLITVSLVQASSQSALLLELVITKQLAYLRRLRVVAGRVIGNLVKLSHFDGSGTLATENSLDV